MTCPSDMIKVTIEIEENPPGSDVEIKTIFSAHAKPGEFTEREAIIATGIAELFKGYSETMCKKFPKSSLILKDPQFRLKPNN